MYISQPVVGRHISNLEDELGFQLFIRDRKSVKLTENGKLFEEFVKDTADRFEAVKERISNNLRGKRMKLIIGTAEGQQIGDCYASAFRYLVDNMPSLTVSVSFFQNAELIGALKAGTIDTAIIDYDDARTLSDIINYKKINHVSSSLIIPITHPKAAKRNLTTKDFENDRFILLSSKDSALTAQMQMTSIKKLGITNYIEAPDISTLSAWAEAGVGITTAPKNHKLCCSSSLVCVDLPELSYEMTEVIAWDKNNSNPAIKAFCDILDKTGYNIDGQEGEQNG